MLTGPLRFGDAGQPSTSNAVTLAPFRVGLDWLTLSMRGPMQILSNTRPQRWRGRNGEDYVWMPTTIRTAVFDRVCYLQSPEGEKLLTIAGGARGGAVKMPPDWMQVQFGNRTLYTGEFLRLYDQLRSMGFSYLSVSRMDVAADGMAGDGGDYLDPIQRTWGGEYEYFGKAHWRPRFERKRVMGAELGTRASNKFLRVYCKTRELKQAHAAGKAEYIKAAWAASLGNPVTNEQTVNRLEVQVKGKEVRRYFPEEESGEFIPLLGNPDQLVDLFSSMVPKVYDFRTAAERSRDAVNGIAWDWSKVAPGMVDDRDRAKKTVAMTPQTLKVMIKQLFILSHATGDVSWREKADELAHAAGLSVWMSDAIGRWTAYVKALRSRGGDYTQSLFDQLTL